VLFSAADLLRAMREALVRGEGEEASEGKPYTMKQFESRWTPQRLGRFLSARLENVAPFEKKTKSKQLRRITLSSFLKAAERYGYEPDERLLKLAAYMGGKMASEKDLNATYAIRTSESETQQQSGSVSAIHTCVESLSANGKMASSQGDKGVVSGGVSEGGGERGFSPAEFAILPPSEKRTDSPFLAETVQPLRQTNEVNELGTPSGKSGKLGEPHMSSYHRESGKLEETRTKEFEEAVEKVLELYRLGERNLWEAAKKALLGAPPSVVESVAFEAAKRLFGEEQSGAGDRPRRGGSGESGSQVEYIVGTVTCPECSEKLYLIHCSPRRHKVKEVEGARRRKRGKREVSVEYLVGLVKCPECGVKLRLIHREPWGHKVEAVPPWEQREEVEGVGA
jgi:DNA-directed RNA polymerase subunit RPC12/RpoP